MLCNVNYCCPKYGLRQIGIMANWMWWCTFIISLTHFKTTKTSGNGMIRNINYSDIWLESVAEVENTEAVQHGCVILSDDEKTALKMSPAFMMYNKIDEENVEVEIEKGMVKARYS